MQSTWCSKLPGAVRILAVIFAIHVLIQIIYDNALMYDSLSKTNDITTGILQSQPQIKNNFIKCDWGPKNLSSCTHLLRLRLGTLPEKLHSHTKPTWLFLGDSTMFRLFIWTKKHWLDPVAGKCGCRAKGSGRCGLNKFYGMTNSMQWTQPNFTLSEGPVVYGLANPRCNDCSGCTSTILECKFTRTVKWKEGDDPWSCIHKKLSALSMYFSVEFARDVEIQTDTSKTTQESIAKWLYKSSDDMRRWNSLSVSGQNINAGASTSHLSRTKTDAPERWLVPISDSAICVINAGLHDMLVKNITDNAYVNNVRWYIRTIRGSGVCMHIIWVHTTAVFHHIYLSNSRIRKWNHLINDMLLDSEFRDFVTIIDTFEESLNWPHNDKVHLNAEWYRSLAMTLKNLYKKF